MKYKRRKYRIKKSRLSWPLRILTYGSATLLLVVLALAIFVRTDFFKKRAELLISQQLQKNVQGHLVFEEIGGSFLTNIVFQGVDLEVGGEKFFHAHQLKIVYFLPALLDKTLYIRKIYLDTPELNLVRDPTGTWNYQSLIPQQTQKGKTDKKTPEDTWSIVLKNIKIKDGSSRITDHSHNTAQPRTRYVKAINLSAGLDLSSEKGRNQVVISLKNAGFESTDPTLKVVKSNGKLRFNGVDLDIADFEIQTENSKGEIKGTIQNINSPVLDLHANFPTLSFKDLTAFAPKLPSEGTVSTDIHLDGPAEALRVSHNLAYRDLKMKSHGVVDIVRPKFSLETKIRNFEPQELLPVFVKGVAEDSIRGDINLDARISAEGKELSNAILDAKLIVHPSSINETQIESGELNVAFKEKNLHIEPSIFHTSVGSCTLHGDGYIGGIIDNHEKIDFTVKTDIHKFDISSVTHREELKSGLNLSCKLRGIKKPGEDIEDLLLIGSIKTEASTMADVAIGKSTIEGQLKGDRLNIKRCHIISDKIEIFLSGQAALKEGIDLSYNIRADDLRLVTRFFPDIAVEGKLNSSGKIRGALRSPALDATFNGQNIHYRDLALQSFVAKVNGKKEKEFHYGNLNLEASNVAWKGTSVEEIDLTGDLNLDKLGFRLNLRQNAARDYRLAGMIDGIGSKAMNVALDNIEVSIDPIYWVNKDRVQIHVSPKEAKIESFHMLSGEEEIYLAGTIEFPETLKMEVNLRSIDIDTITKMAKIDIPLKGKLDTSFSIKGNLSSPIITGNIDLKKGRADVFSFDRFFATLNFGEKALGLKAAMEKDDQRLLTVDGVIPVDLAFVPVKERLLSSGLDISMECKGFDLSLLSSLSKEIKRASGELSLAVDVKGNPRDPSIQGYGSIDNGAVEIAKTGVEYHELNGRIGFDNNNLTIEKLSLKGGEGEAEITGKLYLKEFKPADLNLDLRCNKFKAMDTELFTSIVDANLSLRGPWNENSLTGTITIVESTINIPERETKQIKEIEIIEVEEEGEAKVILQKRETASVLFENLIMDVEVIVPGRSWVRGMGFDAELEGKLAVKKKRKDPVLLVGTIQTVRGTYRFRKNKFIMEEGRVTFTGLPKNDPNLSMRATCRVSKIKVILLLGGTISNPELNVQSEPPMDQADIFAYLLFGKPTDNLSQSEGVQLQETAIGIVGGMAAERLKGILGRTLAPDVIDIQTGSEGGFEVGKYLTKQLFVTYESRFGEEEYNQARVEYQISDQFSLTSEVGNEKTTGVDIFWKYDY